MQPKSSKKPIIILVVVLVLAGLAYFYFTGTPTDTMSGLNPSSSLETDNVQGMRVLTLLNQITSLHIDPEFFKSASYSSLVDHTVPIYDQNVGKANPFFYTASAKAK